MVQFPVGAHAYVVDSVPGWALDRCFSPSLSPFLPLSLLNKQTNKQQTFKASVKPAIPPALVFAAPQSRPGLAIKGIGQNHSPCAFREATTDTGRTELLRCGRTLLVSCFLHCSSPFWGNQSPPVCPQFSFIIHICSTTPQLHRWLSPPSESATSHL